MATHELEITLADETTIRVTPNLFDTRAFESYLRKNPRLGKLQDNAVTLTAFRGWHAAKRKGLTSMTWEEFSEGEDAVLAVMPAGDDETAPEDDDDLDVAGLGLGTRPAQ